MATEYYAPEESAALETLSRIVRRLRPDWRPIHETSYGLVNFDGVHDRFSGMGVPSLSLDRDEGSGEMVLRLLALAFDQGWSHRVEGPKERGGPCAVILTDLAGGVSFCDHEPRLVLALAGAFNAALAIEADYGPRVEE